MDNREPSTVTAGNEPIDYSAKDRAWERFFRHAGPKHPGEVYAKTKWWQPSSRLRNFAKRRRRWERKRGKRRG